MENGESAASVVFQIGPVAIGNTVVTTWGIMLGFLMLGLLLRLKVLPSRWNYAMEAVVVAIEEAVSEVLPSTSVRKVLPFVATLWLYILVANLVGLIPELHSPTRDLSATTALALLVFGSTHWFGILDQGLGNHLRHYAEPNIILLPFHVISEFTRTLALAIRLFGNIMSLEMTALLVLMIAGFLVPVPLLMLHVVEAVVQAYIFGMLALVYIAGALEPSESESSPLSEEKP
ncbi:MAG: F0F1 ATP synthase subunit A [Methylomonas sp.]